MIRLKYVRAMSVYGYSFSQLFNILTSSQVSDSRVQTLTRAQRIFFLADLWTCSALFFDCEAFFPFKAHTRLLRDALLFLTCLTTLGAALCFHFLSFHSSIHARRCAHFASQYRSSSGRPTVSANLSVPTHPNAIRCRSMPTLWAERLRKDEQDLVMTTDSWFETCSVAVSVIGSFPTRDGCAAALYPLYFMA